MKNFTQNSFCQHFNYCSGCQVDLKEANPPIWADVLAYFQKRGHKQPFLHKSVFQGWRYRAKLAVRGTPAKPLIGLFKEGSHEVIPIPFCQVHHPHINRAIEFIHHFLSTHQLQPYNEQTGRGDLRYLQFVVERETGKVQASFILNFKDLTDPRYFHWKSLIEKLGTEDPKGFWHSLWINLNAQMTNTIFGTKWQLIYGEELLWETLNHVSICFQPASFAQANLSLFEQMLKYINVYVPENSCVAEFYAGVGVIGISLASKSLWVRCAEINPFAEECFSYSKNKLPLELAKKTSFQTGAANQLLSILKDANVVIVDPPRKGLDSYLLESLLEPSSIKQIIYVSCGWPSFKNDCERLLNGGWQLDHCEGYWFFPGTNHIEILANFIRN